MNECIIKDCNEEIFELNTKLCFDHWNEYESDDLILDENTVQTGSQTE